MKADQLEPITVLIPAQELERLRVVARRNERSIAAEVRIAVRAHIAPTAERAA